LHDTIKYQIVLPMNFKKIYIITLLFTLFTSAFAQSQPNKPPKRGTSDIWDIKAPKIDAVEADTSIIHVEEGDLFDEYSDAKRSVFDPRRKLSIVSEDTSSMEDGELSIVEVTEEMKMDCVWVKIAEYYSIWDSRSVNPYRIDHSNFKDTVQITLYDSTQGRYFHPPLRKTFVTSDFGARWSRWHFGTDLELDIKDSVFAVFDGIVRMSKYDGGGYGNYITLRHYNGLETLYGHLTKSFVEVGQYVKAGDFIGWGGSTGRSTGPHLHFEVRFEGSPIDAEYFFDFEDGQVISRVCLITKENFQYLNRARKVYYHRVKSGDTIGGIAKKYKVSAGRICKLNGISMRTTLKVGRKLRIR
jgi:murein DD-endopeptidase MepM/ murein hydrolase activator NlpD